MVRIGVSTACLGLSTVHASAQSPSQPCGAEGTQQWLSTRPSPLDSVTVPVGGTVAKICYSRPSARGRSVDSLVPLGRAWRTGANEPTTITLTGAMNVGGVVLGAGRYVILTVPEEDQWRLVFHTTKETEPTKMFQSLTQVATGAGRAERLTTPVEQFTIRVDSAGATRELILEWGFRRARVAIR